MKKSPVYEGRKDFKSKDDSLMRDSLRVTLRTYGQYVLYVICQEGQAMSQVTPLLLERQCT